MNIFKRLLLKVSPRASLIAEIRKRGARPQPPTVLYYKTRRTWHESPPFLAWCSIVPLTGETALDESTNENVFFAFGETETDALDELDIICRRHFPHGFTFTESLHHTADQIKMERLIKEWSDYTRSGLDILASSCLDELRELITEVYP